MPLNFNLRMFEIFKASILKAVFLKKIFSVCFSRILDLTKVFVLKKRVRDYLKLCIALARFSLCPIFKRNDDVHERSRRESIDNFETQGSVSSRIVLRQDRADDHLDCEFATSRFFWTVT